MGTISIPIAETHWTDTQYAIGNISDSKGKGRFKIVPTRKLSSITISFSGAFRFKSYTNAALDCGINTSDSSSDGYMASGIWGNLPSKGSSNWTNFTEPETGYLKSVTFSPIGGFSAGVAYYIWLTQDGSSGNYHAVSFYNGQGTMTVTGETAGGAVRIWSHHMTDAQSSLRAIAINDTYRAGGSLAQDGFHTLREHNLTGTNYVGSGTEGNGYNTTMIPVSDVDFAATAIILTMTVYKSPSGVDTFRWAITTSRENESLYEGWDAVTSEQDQYQLAAGTFTPNGEPKSTSLQTFTLPANIPANTPVYIYLFGSSGEYGNIHITGMVSMLISGTTDIILEWAGYGMYTYTGESWVLYTPYANSAYGWTPAV